ncbi:Glutamine cyclotransferase [Lysobacter silvestris]|uniref:Glutamine cyclotransferase n=2 Tax=Solilutibacter silvestris TaxID=1645665 RepID=A0A2K1PXP7_9GAMM|nr:glutaminyl-peptide cyclotransferase [Lysobacter silvestris]PNS07467.1 Glutamine cyclotransferase [Lysobacter silvestris]
MPCAQAAQNAIPTYGYEVVHRYPHDPSAYTEGLFYEDGFLYESTGGIGKSSIRKVELETGRVIRQAEVPQSFFGEGIVSWGQALIQLTWQDHVGLVYDLNTFTSSRRFSYRGEGWALTRDSHHIYMSDGTPNLKVLDPKTLAVTSIIHVTGNSMPVTNLNELEWVKGDIYANIWLTNRIARIDPASGHVVGWIDLDGLFDTSTLPDPGNDVLNGIAYDAKHDRLFVTGKCWPFVFEIRLTPRTHGRAKVRPQTPARPAG